MNTIFKYKLENIDQQTIVIPFPARILSVVEQDNDIVLYSIVDNEKDDNEKDDNEKDDKDVHKIPIEILIKGTGDIVEDNIGLYIFIGTVKLDGNEMWHVFYRYIDRKVAIS